MITRYSTGTPRAIWSPEATATRSAAYAQLASFVARAQRAGLLGGRGVEEATMLWDALCTGLALREICGPIPRSEGDRLWTEALTAFLGGLGQHAGNSINPATASQ